MVIERLRYLAINTTKLKVYISFTAFGGKEAKATFLNCSETEYEPFDLVIPPTIFYDSRNFHLVGDIDHGFASHSNIRSVEFPSTLHYISSYAFSGCKNLVSVKFNNNLIAIGKAAFSFTALKEVILPDSLLILERQAFKECNDIEKFSFGDGLEKMHDKTFVASHALKELYIGKRFSCYEWKLNVPFISNITVHPKNNNYIIEENMFYSKNHLKLILCFNRGETIKLHHNTVRLCSNAIAPDLPLKNLILPKYFRYINSSFGDFKSLMNIHVDKGNEYYYDVDGVLFSKGTNIIVSYPCGRKEQYEIPDNVEQLSNYVFAGFSISLHPQSLINIKIIGVGAFKNCPNVNGPLYFNDRCRIDEEAFAYCENLNSTIYLPTKAKFISAYAFKNCSKLESIVFPDRLEKICKGAFSGCTSLSGVLKFPKSLIEIDEDAFEGCTSVLQFVIHSKLQVFALSAFNGIEYPRVYYCGNGSILTSCITAKVNYSVCIDWRVFKGNDFCGLTVNIITFNCNDPVLPNYDRTVGFKGMWKSPPDNVYVAPKKGETHYLRFVVYAFLLSLLIFVAIILKFHEFIFKEKGKEKTD